MCRYRRWARVFYAATFIGGAAVHLVLGRLRPTDYAGFADTAAFGWLADLWASFVMPHVGTLTLALALYQLACGVGILRPRTATPAAWGMLAFLLFITVIGYGFPSASPADDLALNRLPTLLLAGLLVPLLAGDDEAGISAWRAWRGREPRSRSASRRSRTPRAAGAPRT